jgi:hypothetical protein
VAEEVGWGGGGTLVTVALGVVEVRRVSTPLPKRIVVVSVEVGFLIVSVTNSARRTRPVPCLAAPANCEVETADEEVSMARTRVSRYEAKCWQSKMLAENNL